MREIKFRCFNGETMISPEYITRDGFAFWKENSILTGSREIMQYTGLKDKNGKEIYEGDIIRGVSNNPFSNGDVKEYEVMWGDCHWHIKGTFLTITDLFEYCNNSIKVIGNIHENPELLTP